MNKPDLEFSAAIRKALDKYPESKRLQLTSWFQERLLPSYLLTSKRMASTPRPRPPSFIGRLFGKTMPPTLVQPILPTLASKFGGQPYLESLDEWPKGKSKPCEYLGQINFAELTRHVPDLPSEGLLVMYVRLDWPCDQPSECRWYPKPDPQRAVVSDPELLVLPRYETKIGFEPSWSLPNSDAWEELLGGNP